MSAFSPRLATRTSPRPRLPGTACFTTVYVVLVAFRRILATLLAGENDTLTAAIHRTLSLVPDQTGIPS